MKNISKNSKCAICYILSMLFFYFIAIINNLAISIDGSLLNNIWPITNSLNFAICLFIGLFFTLGICILIEALHRTKNIEEFTINPIIYYIFSATSLMLVTDLIIGNIYIIEPFKYICLNLFLCFLIIFLINSISNYNKIVNYIFWIFVIIFSLAQFYVVKFRNWIFTIKDFKNLQSLEIVNENFSFGINLTVICVIVNIILVIVFINKVTIHKPTNIKSRIGLISINIPIIILFCILANFTYNHEIERYPFGPPFINKTYAGLFSKRGTLLTIYYDAKYNKLTIPDNYNKENAKQILDNYDKQKTTVDNDILIISILSESLSDPNRYVQFESKDYLPNWRSIDTNVQKGYVTVSPLGGMTCNSEYEFLTGNSMYFLPSQSAIYTMYLDNPQDSILRHLKDYGFYTTAYDPFSPNIWNAGKAYNNLGFDKCIYKNEVIDKNTKMYNSGYISDLDLFKKLTEYDKNNHKNQNEFYFITTAQNHMPFEYQNTGNIKLDDPKANELESYLNGIYDSDKAMQWLFDYYKNDNRKVYIIIYGDHFPLLDYGNYPLVDKNEFNSKILNHQTPYIIWSNQDIGYTWNDNISLNYLFNDVCNIANIPLSPYQQELEKIRKDYPIISEIGYRNKNNNWTEKINNCNYDDPLLNEYNTIQYYKMFDEKIYD